MLFDGSKNVAVLKAEKTAQVFPLSLSLIRRIHSLQEDVTPSVHRRNCHVKL